MHLEGIYSGASALAMIGWLALALAPLRRTLCVAFARILALLLAAAYLAQFFFTTETIDGAGFGSLAEVSALFSAPGNVMMGWRSTCSSAVGRWKMPARKASRTGWFCPACFSP